MSEDYNSIQGKLALMRARMTRAEIDRAWDLLSTRSAREGLAAVDLWPASVGSTRN